MISYHEPERAALSATDQARADQRFTLVLHGFLFLYLALHNFLIPAVLNWLKGDPLLADVHYWFLAQLALAWALRRAPARVPALLTAITAGSLARLLWETVLWAPSPISWGIFSIWLSEGATLIFALFYFLRDAQRPAWGYWWLALGVPLAMAVEIRGDLFHPLNGFQRVEQRNAEWVTRGCQGSRIAWGPHASLAAEGDLRPCGFSTPLVAMGASLRNTTKSTIQLRVSRLRWWDKRPKLQFVRLLILRPGEINTLAGAESEVWLLSSIQQKWVGLQLRVGAAAHKSFPVGTYHVDPYELRYEGPL